MEIKNAKITGTKLGREDHGIFTFMIWVETDTFSTGIGGFGLDYFNKDDSKRVYEVKGLEAISSILDVVGVENWEDLIGKYIRIKYEGRNQPIYEIGNLIKDRWFNLKEFFSED